MTKSDTLFHKQLLNILLINIEITVDNQGKSVYKSAAK